MNEVLERARVARENAVRGVASTRWRALRAHQRAAEAALAAAAAARRSGLWDQERRCLERAAELASRCARLQEQLTGEPIAVGVVDQTVHVHLGFADAESREAVLMLLRDLGDWAPGRLIDRPGEGVRYEMSSPDLELCEAAVRDRLRLAMHELESPEDLVSLIATRPADG